MPAVAAWSSASRASPDVAGEAEQDTAKSVSTATVPHRRSRVVDTLTIVGIDTAMVAVPPGDVTISDRRTLSSWNIRLKPFLLAALPVTRARYSAIIKTPANTGAPSDQRPAENVSWFDAIRFCNTLSERDGLTPAYEAGPQAGQVEWVSRADGYRLPTEAEWEHACRAGTKGARYGPLEDIAWYRGNSGERAHDVGGKQLNAWGLGDMLGNVWEWCWDIYDSKVYGDYRVLRGGGWFDEHWSCRASVRRRSHPTYRIDDVGFRVARTVVTAAAR
jgi:sulfatase modifying factor 1